MRFIDKVRKAFTAEGFLSVRRGMSRALHPQPVSKFLAHVPPGMIKELHAKYDGQMKPGQNWIKYTDAPRWLALNIRRAQDIGLDRDHRHLRVLDLGSGGGYFLFVCRQLGHEGVGLDVPEPTMYGEMFARFGLRRVVQPVTAQQKLPEELLADGSFDLVTAFSIEFNKHAPWGLWTAADWDFLLGDLRDRFVKPDGRVYLDLNPNYPGDNPYMTPENNEVFRQHGAKIDRRSKLTFDPIR